MNIGLWLVSPLLLWTLANNPPAPNQVSDYVIGQPKDTLAFFEGSWEELIQHVEETKKPVFIDVYTVWCGPCLMMDKFTYSDPEVIKYVNDNFIAYKMDAEKGEGIQLAKDFGISSYPTTIFISPNGGMMGAELGFMDAEKFLKVLKKYQKKSAK